MRGRCGIRSSRLMTPMPSGATPTTAPHPSPPRSPCARVPSSNPAVRCSMAIDRPTTRRRPQAGGETHVVLVDNGRSDGLGMAQFWTLLKCIRCGACMNTCPVYRHSGGLSYGATYSGPSATADIEGVLIHGAQGVRSLSVLPIAREAGKPFPSHAGAEHGADRQRQQFRQRI